MSSSKNQITGCVAATIHSDGAIFQVVVTNDYRRHGEEVVVLDITTGDERARVRVGGLMQGVVFPSSGWNRDLYWSSMGRLARIFVQ